MHVLVICFRNYSFMWHGSAKKQGKEAWKRGATFCAWHLGEPDDLETKVFSNAVRGSHVFLDRCDIGSKPVVIVKKVQKTDRSIKGGISS